MRRSGGSNEGDFMVSARHFDRIGSRCVIIFFAIMAVATAQADNGETPEAEFHMARMVYAGGQVGWGWRQWWSIDYPDAEYHFTRGLRRLTQVDVADDSRHLQLTDDEIFDYPWLFAQQAGRWHLGPDEITRLREYVGRGGFLVVLSTVRT